MGKNAEIGRTEGVWGVFERNLDGVGGLGKIWGKTGDVTEVWETFGSFEGGGNGLCNGAAGGLLGLGFEGGFGGVAGGGGELGHLGIGEVLELGGMLGTGDFLGDGSEPWLVDLVGWVYFFDRPADPAEVAV